MNKLVSALALCTLLVIATACSDQAVNLPTAVDSSDEAVTSAKRGGNGFGAVFEENAFIGVAHTDPEGDYCRSRVAAPYEELNSFVRTNPDGSRSIHMNGTVANILFITSGGDLYEGTGHFSVNWQNIDDPDAPVQFSATGDVTDVEGNSFRAKCQYHSNAQGKVTKNENELQ